MYTRTTTSHSTPARPRPRPRPPPPAASPAPLYVGIDVAKDRLDLARSDDTDRVVEFATTRPASPRSSACCRSRRRPGPSPWSSSSPTGGLERPLVEALLEAGLPVALVHPGRVRHFAKALGIESKTDRSTPACWSASANWPPRGLAERRTRNETELRDLLACRRQLTVTRTQQSNRRGANRQPGGACGRSTRC